MRPVDVCAWRAAVAFNPLTGAAACASLSLRRKRCAGPRLPLHTLFSARAASRCDLTSPRPSTRAIASSFVSQSRSLLNTLTFFGILAEGLCQGLHDG